MFIRNEIVEVSSNPFLRGVNSAKEPFCRNYLSGMKKVIFLIAIQVALFGCDRPLKQNKINKWFYGVPIYDDANEVVKMLLSDTRFTILKIPDTTKNTYTCHGKIQQPYLPNNDFRPDSSIIDFTFARFELQTGVTNVKLLIVNYFISNPTNLENLFKKLYNELKPSFTNAHDIMETRNNDTTATGKEFTYVGSKTKSQKLSILKKIHFNGTKSVELTIKMAEQ